MTLLTLALGGAIFLVYRLQHICRRYVRRARKDPTELVPTAGAVIGDVVGRDELCHVIMDDLRARTGRRPHIIIGGVGTGKTAVLVQLTKVLAQNRAVPVAVRLRDAQSELDFRGLARKRFIAEAENALLSSAEGEKVWRQLLKDDRIVVLADGLEEAFAGAEANPDRDNLIRLAIAESQRQGLPLVVTSRPHDPLNHMQAAMLDIEPLSQEAALEYLRGDAAALDERLEWLVESAGVADAPLYLQIAKELHDRGLLRHAHPRQRSEQLDTRGSDRVGLRLGLIDTWIKALTTGHFRAELALSIADRRSALEHLSALACAGLTQDSLHVPFIDAKSCLHKALNDRLAAIDQQAKPTGPHVNWPIAAAAGMQLGLVEPYRDGARFQHSIMQAYLGSRFVFAIAEEDMNAALQQPGRELLMALVMYSRSRFDEDPGDDVPTAPTQAVAREHAATLRDRLRTAAVKRHPDATTLDMLAAALEIDAVVLVSRQAELAADLADVWRKVTVNDRTLEEAKLRAVARFGESVRTVAERPEDKDKDKDKARKAYGQLFAIGGCEESYRVRISIAQEIGVGGDLALEALDDPLAPTDLVQASQPATKKAGPGAEARDGLEAVDSTPPDRALATEPAGAARGHASAGEPDTAESTTDEHPPPIEAGGPDSEAQGRRDAPDSVESIKREHERRKETMRAWLVPMFVGSAHKRTEQASRNLDLWLGRVGSRQHTSDGCLPLAIEVALAQGFKHAANRRPEHPLFRDDARDELAERAREMLETARFWFSRLTLVHALCLWALPETTTYRKGRRQSPKSPGSDPEALVDRWLLLPDGEDEHPFVTEARDLAVLALESGEPERFMWIDESGVVMKVGTRTARPDAHRRRQLWIPPSTGWSTLHPRAQQLVGDVLLLLNLAERGRDPAVRDRRLKRVTRHDLPPCLTAARDHLNPRQTVGTAKTSAPGSNCQHGCQFDLCPYPPKGEQAYRAELSEAFCRRQQTLLLGIGPMGRRGAPWQAALPKELKRFWIDMEERARR